MKLGNHVTSSPSSPSGWGLQGGHAFPKVFSKKFFLPPYLTLLSSGHQDLSTANHWKGVEGARTLLAQTLLSSSFRAFNAGFKKDPRNRTWRSLLWSTAFTYICNFLKRYFEREYAQAGGGRGTSRLSTEHRAQHRTRAVTKSWMLNRLSHSGAPI